MERRQVLISGTSAAALAALAGCRSSAEKAREAAPTTQVNVPASDVPVGGAVILTDAPYVISQPTKGEFHAFSKICTHQGCPVSKLEGDHIMCLCHGSAFKMADGTVVRGPAETGLGVVKVVKQGDTLVVGG